MSTHLRLEMESSSSAGTNSPTEHVWSGNHMKWIFSLIALLVLKSNFISAQEHWSPYLINEGEGGQVINDIAVSKADPDFIMMGTDVGGLFRSTDGGANWIPTGMGLSGLNTLTLQIDQSNANRVFMVSGSPFNVAGQQDGIWMSTDKGITWSQVLRDDNNSKNGMYDRLGEQLVIDGSSYDAGKGYCTRMYYSSATGTFYTSTDGGSIWNTSTALTVNAYHLSMNNSTGDIFAWSTNNDLLRSTDKGSSFQKIYTGIDWPAHVRNVGNKTYMVVHHDKVYVSTDNGNSFTATGNNGWPASNSNSYIERFEVSPANNNNMTLLVGDSRYYSNDGGNNWGLGDFSNLGHSVIDGIAGKADRAFAWHATDGNIGWDTRHDFVTKTFDGGKTYKWSNKGYTGIFLGQRNTFHFNSQNPDYITLPSCDWNGATTYDAGKTWYDVSINGKWYGWNFSAYAVSPGVWFFAECEDNNFYKPVLRITRDYGKTYETQNLGQGWLPSTSSYLDPTDVNVWFYNTYRSTDAGKTWNGTDKGVVVLTHDNKTNALYGYSYDTGWAVFKSTDKGATFQKVFSAGGGDLRDIAVDNVNGFIYACHDFYVEKYNVSTGTFETMGAFPKDQYGNGPTTRSVAVDPVDPKIVYVANGGHFYAPDNSIMRSKDGGATWESITPSPRNNNTKYATPGGGGAIDALWCRVNPKTRELLVGTNDFGFWTIGAPGSVTTTPPPTAGNLISNPGFEADKAGTQTPQSWTKWQANSADVNVNYTESSGGAGPAHSGTYYGVHYKATAWQQVNTIQNLTGLANGKYTLSAYVKSTAAIGSMYAGLFDSNNNYITTAIPVTTTWTQISMDVVVANGKCEIGFLSASAGNQWIAYDDVSFSLKAGGIVSGSTYEITNKNSGKALDVNGGPTATQDGANVQQWTYGGGTNQQWKVTDVGGGYYKLTAKHSGKCLDVNASGTTDGTNVQQWTDNGGDAQKWTITDVGGGYYKLIVKCSGKALDVNGSGTADGTNVQQWTDNGTDAQKWAFTLLSASGAREASANGKKVENTEPALTNFNVYPNPANGIANISYTASHNEQIAIHLYDTQGRLVKTIFTGTALKGVTQNYPVDGSSLKEGLYIIKLKTSSETINKKVIFDK